MPIINAIKIMLSLVDSLKKRYQSEQINNKVLIQFHCFSYRYHKEQPDCFVMYSND